MKFLTNEEVADRAQRWVQFWRIVKYRDKMESVMDGLNEADKRRVRLCGQRMSVGLPLKVLPAPEQGKEDKHETKDKAKRRRPDGPAVSTKGHKEKTPVGTNSKSAGGSNGGPRSRNQK